MNDMNNGRAIDRVRRGLRRRHAAERRFRRYGMAAVLCGLAFLALMFASIISNGYSAFWQHYLSLDVRYAPEYFQNLDDLQNCDYDGVVKDALREAAPWLAADRRGRRELNRLGSSDAVWALRDRVVANPDLVGTSEQYWMLLDDDADMFFKGYVTPIAYREMDAEIAIVVAGERVRVSGDAAAFAPVAAGLQRAAGGDKPRADKSVADKTPADFPSYLVEIGGVYIKAQEADGGVLNGEILSAADNLPARAGEWRLITLQTPAADRRLSDRQIAALLSFQDQGRVESRFNTVFFSAGDSREPEQAGILSALKGSMYMLIVTLILSFPVGVAAAVYLEEFAPQNRWTDFIEVNINNLAAVPSIVFGLLGLAVFLNFFALPRSAPLVGGLVLTLMTLPTIIISGRAALKSVPPSIREAALGVGASRTQTVFYHVLPLALPGMLTGTIIGMAQALGESAPLLMIGMVAFIVDVPQTFTDPSTALPVQIYLWADSPERAFVERTSAAIMVLLGFLITMNAAAVVLRKRFERRW